MYKCIQNEPRCLRFKALKLSRTDLSKLQSEKWWFFFVSLPTLPAFLLRQTSSSMRSSQSLRVCLSLNRTTRTVSRAWISSAPLPVSFRRISLTREILRLTKSGIDEAFEISWKTRSSCSSATRTRVHSSHSDSWLIRFRYAKRKCHYLRKLLRKMEHWKLKD